MDRLVANLLELSRLEAGAATPARELWTVDGLVARTLDAIGTEDERVDIDLPSEAPPIDVDPMQIERALVNLLENALKFSPPTERISLRARSTSGEIVIRVRDHGPGLPAHEHERIFEPFVRRADAEGDRGSGLGLAIARGFVNVNGGRLWIESESGGGATFALALPARPRLRR